MDTIRDVRLAGSSPLARGTLLGFVVCSAVCRLIPARAGNTAPARRCRSQSPAHPRSRGEHPAVTEVMCSGDGSSPLARGTRGVLGGRVLSDRLIPARAGNTHRAAEPHHLKPAHPRSRGEHLLKLLAIFSYGGSSPLARGTQDLKAYPRTRERLIPARAGNTGAPVKPYTVSTAHPRSRGEHGREIGDGMARGGSSPLARGTLTIPNSPCSCMRLIPARAGNTSLHRIYRLGRSAHPRSRGEHTGASAKLPRLTGSSPLARGTQDLKRRHPVSKRLIPARAGNTHGNQQLIGSSSAHPRSRGEHNNVNDDFLYNRGSSPLARGTPARDICANDNSRLIPARAGNTTPS